MGFFGPNPTLGSISDSFAIKPNSKGVNYKFQKFTDFLDGGETGTNGIQIVLGDNGSLINFATNLVGARTGVDSSFSPPAVMEPAIGVRFIRTQSTLNNRGALGIQRSQELPASTNSSSQLYSLRCGFNSVANVVFRMSYTPFFGTDLFGVTDAVGFELDTSISPNFQALKGFSSGSLQRENTSITASASKAYVFAVELMSSTSHRFRIFEQTAANSDPTSVYDSTLSTAPQNTFAYQFGIKTLASAEKIIYLDWFLARYANDLSATDNNRRFPFAL
jgi:hypothetical protein